MIAWLQASALRVQLPLVVSMVPLVLVLLGIPLAPLAVEVALEGQPREVLDDAVGAVRIIMWVLVGCVLIAAAGAVMVLRVSLGSAVDRLGEATRAIARGDFRHRIESRRTDELGQLAGSIDTMAERLERLEHARRQFLACVSHELRTPLTIIRGHAFTLARTEADVVRRERLEMIQDESQRLADLIDDLVDAASLRAGSVRLRVARHELGELVAIAAARFREEAEQRGLRIEIDSRTRWEISVVADHARFGQVMANLLANAVRHARPGTAIRIEVDSPRGARGERIVDICNVGSPIDPELADQLFEPFVQGPRGGGCVGLGLAIERDLMSAHGGDLGLASAGAEDGVVRFRCTLPAPRRDELRASECQSVIRLAPSIAAGDL